MSIKLYCRFLFYTYLIAFVRPFTRGPLMHYLRLVWFVCCLLCGLAGPARTQAQTVPDSTKTAPNSSTAVTPKRYPVDSLVTPYGLMLADSAERARDSVRYTRLKLRMSKGRITRELYNALFRDVYNARPSGEVNKIEVNPYKAYEGRIIGTIFIRRLGVFGASVYDTTRNAANWVEKLGNRLHVNTREGIIRRSYLQFHEGDKVNPTVLRDNERLLRNVGLFIDVRILVVPRPQSRQFVDVYVITQDVWSLLPDGGFSGFNNFQFGLDQRNFRGLGHQLFNRISYNATLPGQKTEYQGRYVIPYIGKTFLTGRADAVLLRDLKYLSAKVGRVFLNPDTKWAGQLELGRYWTNSRIYDRQDSLLSFPLNYYFSDIWIGRSFPSPFRVRNPEDRARIVVAGRLTAYDYTRRPEVTADSNQLYQNRRTSIFSIGYSQRRYVRDVLIYGFGRTEDVPYGTLASFVGGFEEAELGQRNYAGISLSRGQYFRKVGYVYGLLNMGSFFRKGRREQSLLNIDANYFSPLMRIKWGQMRHFVNAHLTVGADRFNNESLNLNGNNLFGAGGDGLFGTKRLVVDYENLLFSRANIAGFRIAFLTFANIGLVNYADRSLLSGPLYQGYGIGFRLRNENLTFNSLQIRFAYYPNLPYNPNALRYAFEGVPVLRFRDFDISTPQVNTFQ